MELPEELRQEFLESFLDFRAGNVLWVVKIKPKIELPTRRSMIGKSHLFASNKTSLFTFQVKKNSAPAPDAL